MLSCARRPALQFQSHLNTVNNTPTQIRIDWMCRVRSSQNRLDCSATIPEKLQPRRLKTIAEVFKKQKILKTAYVVGFIGGEVGLELADFGIARERLKVHRRSASVPAMIAYNQVPEIRRKTNICLATLTNFPFFTQNSYNRVELQLSSCRGDDE